MTPEQLITELVRRTKLSTLQVATKMGGKSFQGTLHKFMAGHVKSPSRGTAEKIAGYFEIPVDALYDKKEATRVAERLGIKYATNHTSQPVTARESEAPGTQGKGHHLSHDTLMRIAALHPKQLRGLEAAIKAHLDAIAPEQDEKKSASG